MKRCKSIREYVKKLRKMYTEEDIEKMSYFVYDINEERDFIKFVNTQKKIIPKYCSLYINQYTDEYWGQPYRSEAHCRLVCNGDLNNVFEFCDLINGNIRKTKSYITDVSLIRENIILSYGKYKEIGVY